MHDKTTVIVNFTHTSTGCQRWIFANNFLNRLDFAHYISPSYFECRFHQLRNLRLIWFCQAILFLECRYMLVINVLCESLWSLLGLVAGCFTSKLPFLHVVLTHMLKPIFDQFRPRYLKINRSKSVVIVTIYGCLVAVVVDRLCLCQYIETYIPSHFQSGPLGVGIR